MDVGHTVSVMLSEKEHDILLKLAEPVAEESKPYWTRADRCRAEVLRRAIHEYAEKRGFKFDG
jgi:hypothetical protein